MLSIGWSVIWCGLQLAGLKLFMDSGIFSM